MNAVLDFFIRGAFLTGGFGRDTRKGQRVKEKSEIRNLFLYHEKNTSSKKTDEYKLFPQI